MLARWAIRVTNKETGDQYYADMTSAPGSPQINLYEHPPDAAIMKKEPDKKVIDHYKRWKENSDEYEWEMVKVTVDYEVRDEG